MWDSTDSILLSEVELQDYSDLQNEQEEDPEDLQQYISRNQLQNHRRLRSIEDLFIRFYQNRILTLKSLIKIRDKIDKHNKNVTIARVSGSSTSVAGGIVSVIGLGLLPFTGGLSLILLATGGTVSVLGGATNLGSNITLKILVKKFIKKVTPKIQRDQELRNILNQQLNDFQQFLKQLNRNMRIRDPLNGFRIAAHIIQGGFALYRLADGISDIVRSSVIIARYGLIQIVGRGTTQTGLQFLQASNAAFAARLLGGAKIAANGFALLQRQQSAFVLAISFGKVITYQIRL